MEVKNLNGTSDLNCSCGSWLKHWKYVTKREIPYQCVVEGCSKPVEHGGHVQKTNGQQDWYIIPLCKSCNDKKGATLILKSLKYNIFASANVSETCGKKGQQ